MLRLDKNDPLDRMILQELRGEPVPFDVWLEALEELDEDPDLEQILQERNLNAADVLREAEACQEAFDALLRQCGLSKDCLFELCRELYLRACQNPSPELLNIYETILCAPGFLLAKNAEPVSDEDREDEEEEMILQYLTFCQDRDELRKTLAQRKELSQRFSEAIKIRNPRPADCDVERRYEVVKCFTDLFSLPDKGDGGILLENLAAYMQIAAACPALKAIEPLFLFRLLTRHQSRMCTVSDLNVKLDSLWKPDKQQIERDNGKNFKQYRLNLRLFIELCKLYQKDKAVDLTLCWYGLDQITVLGDFYREHISLGWIYADEENEFCFPPIVEELVEESVFSCSGYELRENVLVEDGDVTFKELSKFQETLQPLISRTLEEISDYMNGHVLELALRFSKADAGETRNMCRKILEQSEIKYQPSSVHETALFLAAINNGLFQCLDGVAEYLLAQTGHALLGEPVEILEWPE